MNISVFSRQHRLLAHVVVGLSVTISPSFGEDTLPKSGDIFLEVFPMAPDFEMELTQHPHKKLKGVINKRSIGKTIAIIDGIITRIGCIQLNIKSDMPELASDVVEWQLTDIENRKTQPGLVAQMWISDKKLGMFSEFFDCDQSCKYYRLRENIGSDTTLEKVTRLTDEWDIANGEINIRKNGGKENPSDGDIASLKAYLKKKKIILTDCDAADPRVWRCGVPLGLEDYTISLIAELRTDMSAVRGAKIRDADIATSAFQDGTLLSQPLRPETVQASLENVRLKLLAELTKMGLNGVSVRPRGYNNGLLYDVDATFYTDRPLPDGSLITSHLSGYWCRSKVQIGVSTHHGNDDNTVETIDLHVVKTKIFKGPSKYTPSAQQYQPISLVEKGLEADVVDTDVTNSIIANLTRQLRGVVLWSSAI